MLSSGGCAEEKLLMNPPVCHNCTVYEKHRHKSSIILHHLPLRQKNGTPLVYKPKVVPYSFYSK
jgi:hypothetical protein